MKTHCQHCRYFNNNPVFIEKSFGGLTAMSSGFASVRAQDGLCLRHGLYLPAWDSCGDFQQQVKTAAYVDSAVSVAN